MDRRRKIPALFVAFAIVVVLTFSEASMGDMMMVALLVGFILGLAKVV